MKRFMTIIVLFSVSILAVWAIFAVFATTLSETESDNMPIKVQDERDEMLKADQPEDLVIPVTGVSMKISPVFDSTGAVVSDPTGTMLSVINP